MKDLPLVTKAGYHGIVFDVEVVSGSATVMIPLFQSAFALAKHYNLTVTVTFPHSGPDLSASGQPNTVALLYVDAWVKDEHIDIISP